MSTPLPYSTPSAASVRMLRLIDRLPLPRAIATGIYPLLVSTPAVAARMFDGSILVCDIRDYRTRELLATNIYEPTLTRVFRTLIQPGHVVYDIGANVGYFTVLASRLVGTKGRVFAFEPLGQNTRFIAASLAANDISNVRVVEAFCGDRHNAHETMTLPTPDNSGTGSFVAASSSKSCSVPTIAVTEFTHDEHLAQVDFLKMDIEGAEAVAIRGLLEGLDRKIIKLLAIEFHPEHLGKIGADMLALKRMVTSRGYRAFEIFPPDKLIDRTDTTLEGSFMVFAAPGTSIFSQSTVDLLPIDTQRL